METDKVKKDFRLVYYDTLNGYYKMSPIDHPSLLEAEKYAELIKEKRNPNSVSNIYGIVELVKVFDG